MTGNTLEAQVRQLVVQLTPVQKVRLIEWLGAILGRELVAADQPVQANGHTLVPSVEEQAIDLYIPKIPKTGAELVAWLAANPDSPEEEQNPDNWATIDIDHIATWVHDLRRRPRKIEA